MGALTEQRMLEQHYRFGTPLPERIRNAPELTLGLELFYNGFLECSSCRPLGMSEGPIPHHAIADYASRAEMDPEQREDFLWITQRLDQKYLEWSARKRGGKSDGNAKSVRSANVGARRKASAEGG